MTPLPDPAVRPSPAPATPGTLSDAYGPLLYLSDHDRRGLEWLKVRARQLLNGLKRRRKFALPAGAMFTPEESEVIGYLAALETATGKLLELSGEGGHKRRSHEM